MGNSEVGHQNIGAGAVPYQDIVRIDLSLKDGSMAHNPALVGAFDHAKKHGGKVHFAGLVSDGGVHSHIRHLFGLLRLAKQAGVPDAVVQVFTDGRDTPPSSAKGFVADLEAFMQKELGGYGRIGSICGRYYAMDRDKKWDRVEVAFKALVRAEGEQVDRGEIAAAIQRRYDAGENDEFFKPMVITGGGDITLKDQDSLVFFDFRADRMRAIAHILGNVQPRHFEDADLPRGLHVVCMTQYNEEFSFPLIISVQIVANTLSEWLSKRGLKQIHVAETEKFAHVGFFFRGRADTPFPNEEVVMVPSPTVATYDLKPNMSQAEVADEVVKALKGGATYPFVLCNLAPPDMVGHTGVYQATVEACTGTDLAIGRIWEACKQSGHVLVITADHGNAEQMLDEKGGPFTAHTMNYVPLIVADPKGEVKALNRSEGILADVAPTILHIMGIPVPPEMTGKSFL